jgi:hypothetical protein
MGINVVEGNFIKMSSNYDEIKDIAKNLTGYLRISVKKSDGFEEGYIFLENGKRVGYYYNYGMEERSGKNAEEIVNAMKDSDYVVDIYEYDDSKLKLMKDLFKEIFIKDTPKPKKITPAPTYKPANNNKGSYQKIVLNIPEGKPLKFGANGDYMDYLKGKVLLDAFKKEGGNYKRCYVVYEDETPILAAYEDNNGVLFGKEAYSIIEDLLNDPDTVVDVYRYDESKMDILREYYPEMSLIEKSSAISEFDEEEEDLEEFMESLLLNKQKESKKVEEEENLSKEELLKKFGIKLPDEDSIENLISDVVAPSNEELEDLTNEIAEKIKKFLEKEEDIDNFDMDISVVFNEGYVCEGKITIVPKKKFGLIKKNINKEFIMDKINMIIRENILDIEPKVEIEVK